MSTKITFKKHTPCPVCGEGGKGCSYKLDSGLLEVLFCRKASPNQWDVIETQEFGKIKCNSPSTPGDRQWSSWVLADDKDKSDRAYVHNRTQKAEKLSAKITDIDETLSHILPKFGYLSSRNKDEIKRRGFSDQDIKEYFENYFYNWIRGEKFDNLTPVQGIDSYGNTLGIDGLFIPSYNHFGQLQGGQIKPYKKIEGCKYIWLSSASVDEYGIRISSDDSAVKNEVPIFFNISNNATTINKIIITEGAGKPRYTAVKLWKLGHDNVAVIGAAGGNFANSKQQLKNFFNDFDLSKDVEILIAVDAGAIDHKDGVSNLSVINQLQTTYNVLTQDCGLKNVKFIWYGQESKADGQDIDEISNEKLLQVISGNDYHINLKDFLALVKSPDQPQFAQPPETEPDQEEYQKYLEYEEDLQQIKIKEIEQKRLETWLKLRKFTPDITLTKDSLIEGKYFDYRSPEENEILAICTFLGSGKNEYVIRELIKKTQENGIIYSAHRNALINQAIARFNDSINELINGLKSNLEASKNNLNEVEKIAPTKLAKECIDLLKSSGREIKLNKNISIQIRQKLLKDISKLVAKLIKGIDKTSDLRDEISKLESKISNLIKFDHAKNDNLQGYLVRDEKSNIGLCPDSLWRFKNNLENLTNRTVIIDEVNAYFKHCNNIGDNNVRLLELMISECRRGFFLEGNMRDYHLNYLRAIAPDKKITSIFVDHNANKLKIKFINDESKILEMIKKDNGNIVIATDSCRKSESLYEMRKRIFPDEKHLMINAKTITDPEVQEFLEKVRNKDYFDEQKYKTIIFSPSIDGGLDIPHKKYFKSCYALFYGVIGIDEYCQMLMRLRDTEVERYIFCVEKARQNKDSEGYSPYQIKKNLQDILAEEIEKNPFLSDSERGEIINNYVNYHNTPFAKLQQTQLALLNIEKTNPRKFLKIALEESKHEILEDDLDTGDQECLKDLQEISKEIKITESQKLIDSESIDLTRAKDILKNGGVDFNERLKAEKTILTQEMLPGIESTCLWQADQLATIRSNNYEPVRKLLTYYYLKNPQITDQISQIRQSKISNGELNLGFFGYSKNIRIETNGLIRKKLSVRDESAKIKLLHDLGITGFLEGTWRSGDLEDFENKCREHSKHIKRLLGVNPRKKPVQIINSIVKDVLGLKIATRQIRIGDKRDRTYSVNFDCEKRNAILGCIKQKFDNLDLPKITPENGGNHRAVTGTGVTDISTLYINKDEKSVTNHINKENVTEITKITPENGGNHRAVTGTGVTDISTLYINKDEKSVTNHPNKENVTDITKITPKNGGNAHPVTDTAVTDISTLYINKDEKSVTYTAEIITPQIGQKLEYGGVSFEGTEISPTNLILQNNELFCDDVDEKSLDQIFGNDHKPSSKEQIIAKYPIFKKFFDKLPKNPITSPW